VTRSIRRLTPLILLLTFSLSTRGQESVTAPPGPVSLIGVRVTPLQLATRYSLSDVIAASDPLTAPAPMQYGVGAADWEVGRAWLGSLVGLGLAYAGDQLVHYQDDFSKGNMFLNEDNGSGEVVYNVLLYGAFAPLFSLRSLRRVNPWYGNPTGGYLGGVVGSLAGLAYWTNLGKVNSASGILVTSGLMAIGTTLGYHLFRRPER
jgi:hypothetical protein